jgi:hypothetical protein
MLPPGHPSGPTEAFEPTGCCSDVSMWFSSSSPREAAGVRYAPSLFSRARRTFPLPPGRAGTSVRGPLEDRRSRRRQARRFSVAAVPMACLSIARAEVRRNLTYLLLVWALVAVVVIPRLLETSGMSAHSTVESRRGEWSRASASNGPHVRTASSDDGASSV